jgi:hypothetical protein
LDNSGKTSDLEVKVANNTEFIILLIVSVWLRSRPGDRGSIPGRGKRFVLCHLSRPALGPTQLPVQRIPGVLSPGVKYGRGVTLTTHYLVPKLRMSRSYTFSAPPPKRLRAV